MGYRVLYVVCICAAAFLGMQYLHMSYSTHGLNSGGGTFQIYFFFSEKKYK